MSDWKEEARNLARMVVFHFGLDLCKEAWKRNRIDGDGANSISWELSGVEDDNTNQVDIMINAYDIYKEQI